MLQFAGAISESIQSILISFDSTLYRFVGWLYEVYLLIASARIIQQDDIENFMKRLMVVVGIVTLFIIAFSLIKALIDPEKEVKNTSKIFVNVITSIIMLTLVNTAFNYLYQFQNVLLKNNVIGRIIIGGVKSGEFDINSAGTDMAADTFAAFFTDDPYIATRVDDNEAKCRNKDGEIIDKDDVTDETECYYVSEEAFLGINSDYTSIAEVTENAKKSGNLTVSFLDLAKPVDNKAVDFSFFLALICAGFMIYIFVSFCLDMAVRCAKLAVLQIISPVPILARIIPGQESIFNNWIKKTMSTFMEVFIRIAVIFFCIYLISSVSRSGGINFSHDILSGVSGRGVESTAKVAIILGILMFAKQAPGFISQIFGIDSGNMKLGIKDKLASAGVFAGGAAVGAFATQGIRNFRDNYANSRDKGHGRLRSLVSGTRSGIAGSVSAGVRAGYNGRGAKNLKDMKGAASTGTANAAAARDRRREYIEQHHGVRGALLGHIKDTGESIANWAGSDQAKYSRLERKYNSLNETNSKVKEIDDKASNWMNKQANNIKVNSFKWKDVNGKTITSSGTNLGILRNMVNQAKTTGKREDGTKYTAEELTNLDKMLFAAEKQVKKDFVVGNYNSVLNTKDSTERESLLKGLQTSIADQTHLDTDSATKPNEVKDINLSNVDDVTKMYDNIKEDLDKQLYTTQSEMNQISEKNRKKNDKK